MDFSSVQEWNGMVLKKSIFSINLFYTGKIVILLLSFAPPRALDFPELWEAEQSVQQGKLHKKILTFISHRALE